MNGCDIIAFALASVVLFMMLKVAADLTGSTFNVFASSAGLLSHEAA